MPMYEVHLNGTVARVEAAGVEVKYYIDPYSIYVRFVDPVGAPFIDPRKITAVIEL